MKKSLIWVFTIILSIRLTGCQFTPLTQNETIPSVIRIWHYYSGPQKDSFDKLINRYNETVGIEKGIVVESIYQGTISDLSHELIASARRQVDAQELPTIFLCYPDMAYSVNAIVPLLELEDYFNDKQLTNYVSSFLEEGYIDDHLKIFPVAKSSEVMLINKTFWDKFAESSGYTYDDLATWESLATVAEDYYTYTDELTDTPNDGKALLGRDSLANYLLVGSAQLGHPLISNHTRSINLDKKTLRKLWDNYYVPFIKGHYFSYGRFSADDAKIGDVIFNISSTTGVPYFPSSVIVDEHSIPIEVAILPVPNFENRPAYAVQQGAGMAVIASSDESINQAATSFIQWFTKPVNNMDFSMSSIYTPVNQDTLDLKKLKDYATSHSDDALPRLVPALTIAINQFNHSTLYYQPPIKNGFAIRTIFQNHFLDTCKQNRQEVIRLINEGTPTDIAYGTYMTEDIFEQFYTELVEKINSLR